MGEREFRMILAGEWFHLNPTRQHLVESQCHARFQQVVGRDSRFFAALYLFVMY